MQRLWAIVDHQRRATEWQRKLVLGLALGGIAIGSSAASRIWLGIDLPFAFGLAGVVFAAGWGGALPAMIVTAATVWSVLLFNLGHPLVTPINVATVTAFSITLALFGGRMTALREHADFVARRAVRREAYLHSIFDTTPAAMLITTNRGEILAINASARRIFDLDCQTPETLCLSDILRTAAGDLIPVPGQGVITRADGKRTVLAVSSIALPIATTKFCTYYIRDETASVEAADQLATLQSELQQLARATALGQLGSSIAHELNQPLAAAANFARVAQASLLRGRDGHEVEAAMEATLHQIFRAAAVLRRLREFVQRGPLKAHWIDACHVITEGVGLGTLALRQVQADLTVEIDEDIGDLLGDAIQIQQVILNLLSNAAEAVAGAADRRISLTARSGPPDRLTITVTDSGHGILPAMKSSVFTPFRTTKKNGLGVGLAICRTIIEAHHGAITYGPGEGGGAAFSFTLPRRSARKARANAA